MTGTIHRKRQGVLELLNVESQSAQTAAAAECPVLAAILPVFQTTVCNNNNFITEIARGIVYCHFSQVCLSEPKSCRSSVTRIKNNLIEKHRTFHRINDRMPSVSDAATIEPGASGVNSVSKLTSGQILCGNMASQRRRSTKTTRNQQEEDNSSKVSKYLRTN